MNTSSATEQALRPRPSSLKRVGALLLATGSGEYRKKKLAHSVLCLVFWLFVFLLFWRYEPDVLRFTFFRLTGKEPHAAPFTLALLLTTLLSCLHRLVSLFVYFRDRHYALTLLPSAVVAVLLTSFVPTVAWGVIAFCVVALIAWAVLSLSDFRRRQLDKQRHLYRIVPRLSWHAAWLCALLLFVGIGSNGNRHYHAQLRMAELIRQTNYAAALHEADVEGKPERLFTALRAYALSKSGRSIAEELFVQPLERANHTFLFLHKADERVIPIAPVALYDHLGVYPQPHEADAEYLRRLYSYRPFASNTPARDYYFTALLLNKRLADFVRDYTRYHRLGQGEHNVPRAYAEALVLHDALHPTDSLRTELYLPHLHQNFRDFQEQRSRHKARNAQHHDLRSLYGNTYWWYYFYANVMRSDE